MKALILAAGIASRLRPLTDNTPKCLLKVGNKNILSLTLDNIISNRIQKVVVVTGYREDQIKNFIASEYPTLDVKYIYNPVYDSTNNIYSLWLVKNEFAGEDMLLMDSDIIFDQSIITKLLNSGFDNCLALKKHEVQEEEIKVKGNSEGRILKIGKEVIPKEAMGESIGIEKFSAPLVEKLYKILDHLIIRENKVNLFYEAAFQNLIDDGESIFAVDITEHKCMEIDTAHDLEMANRMITENY
jgi:choline kinase